MKLSAIVMAKERSLKQLSEKRLSDLEFGRVKGVYWQEIKARLKS